MPLSFTDKFDIINSANQTIGNIRIRIGHNFHSYKTIEKLGAELVEICDVPREYFAWREGMERRRIYKLNL